ncbi:Alanine dehydrogenase [compost metagenome]
MPGAVARTSTLALTNATTPYGLQIATKGYRQAALDNAAIAKGINVMMGKVTYLAVADAQGIAGENIHELLKANG